jgi:F-type H+-transporting ATPase subunit c
VRHQAQKENFTMNKLKTVCLLLAMLLLVAAPSVVQAQEEGAEAGGGVAWGALAAAFAIGVAAFGGALGQAKATSAAVSGMARNPGAAGNIRTTLIIGLALIESLVIYALLIAFFVYQI